MLRLIALALLLPLTAEAQLPDPQGPEPWKQRPTTLRTPELKPADVAVPPEENALRDLMPGWVPCRALTEEEMTWSDSPHRMRSGGFYFAGNARGAPVVPAGWTEGWPEPGPLIATGVPRGWWWRPEDPKWWGAWIVLGKGDRKGHRFYSMVTTPLRGVDYGSIAMIPAIRKLYDALRDRVAKRREVDPATLDAESERLAQGGYAMPPSVIQQAIDRAKALDRQDKLEEAAELLDITLDDGGGLEVERLAGLLLIGRLYLEIGDFARARRHIRDAREIAADLAQRQSAAHADQMLPMLDKLDAAGPQMPQIMRATASEKRKNWPAAISGFRKVLPALTEPFDQLGVLDRLAHALRHNGDSTEARRVADRALVFAERLDEPEIAAKMKRLLAELGPPDATP